MKILTKEEESAHYHAVVKGGSVGTLIGLAGGAAGTVLASRRWATIRNLTMPMKAFLVTSSATFVGIIAADHASRDWDVQHNAEKQWFETREERLRAEEMRGMTFADRAVAFARREKYKIIGVTWIASMIGSFALVGRNPYLTGQQKIVQARVYAQGLTLGVLCASAAFEISDQRRGRGILDSAKKPRVSAKEDAAEPAPVRSGNKDEGDLWKDMVAAEEQRLKSKHQSLHYKHQEKGEGEEEKNSEGEEKKEQSEDSGSEEKDQKKSQSKEESKPEKKQA